MTFVTAFLMGKFLSVPYRYDVTFFLQRKHTRYRVETKQRVVRLLDEFKIDVVWWGMFFTYIRARTFIPPTGSTHTHFCSRRGTSDIGDDRSGYN